MSPLVAVAAGLAALVLGASVLVSGASRLAAILGIPPTIIGLTVVAFGTSGPELAVSTAAALRGDSAIALGNVVGSNIFNVLLILGLSALVRPLLVAPIFIRREVPIMIAASLLLWLLALDGSIGRIEGVLLAAGILGYILVQIRGARSSDDDSSPVRPPLRTGTVVTSLLAAIAGLGLLVVGSEWLVVGARAVAEGLGVPDLVIGLTLVAAGTSLPELATSVVATFRGERDIAVGNIVGSNIFNLLAILGVAALVGPGGVQVPDAALGFDIPVMTLVAAVCLPIFLSGRSVGRLEGALLIIAYVAYVVVLALTTEGPLPGPGAALLLPLSAVVWLVWLFLARRAEQRGE
jgi:cation:H+ antiporter